MRYVQVSVPGWAWQQEQYKEAWNNCSVRSVWLRKMWRAYLVLWKWSIALRRGEKGTLLGFLHGPMNAQEKTQVAEMIEDEFKSVNTCLLRVQTTNQPMWQPREYQ